MSCDSYLRVNFRNFDIERFLDSFGLEDEDTAKRLFQIGIDKLATCKSSPATRWARDVKSTEYALVSTTKARDVYNKKAQKRAIQQQEFQALVDRTYETSTRVRVVQSLDRAGEQSAKRKTANAGLEDGTDGERSVRNREEENEEEDSDEEENREDEEEDEEDEESENDDEKFVQKLLADFKRTFDSMDDRHKWTLASGKKVEDALFTFGCKCQEEHLVHSFLIDPSDPVYAQQKVFTCDELEEIAQFNKKPKAYLPEQLRDYIHSFAANDCKELRKKIDTQWAWQENYDLSVHGDLDWVRNTIYNLVREYEAKNFEISHLEAWYTSHVWHLFDTIFDSLNEVEVVRGEPSSYASASRKNAKRQLGAIKPISRKRIGRKCDSIIRIISTKHDERSELGASESSRKNDRKGTKVLKEKGLKLPKVLRDMYNSLCAANQSQIRELETIGYIHHGLACCLLRLDSPAGYVARLSYLPGRLEYCQIPSKIDRFTEDALPVLVLAWQAKQIVSRVLNAIHGNNSEIAKQQSSSWLDSVFDFTPVIAMPHCSHSDETKNKSANKRK